MTTTVVQDWLSNCTLKQQTVLLCALRGCDGVSKEDPSKTFVRQYRRLILRDAGPPDADFMKFYDPSDRGYKMSFHDLVGVFASDIDHYPMHWLMHFIHAMEIVGYKHPDTTILGQAHYFYITLADALHLTIETEEDLDERLADFN